MSFTGGVGVIGGIALALVAGSLVAGCGDDSGATQEQLDRAREEGAREARDQAQVKQLQRQVARLRRRQRRSERSSARNQPRAQAPGTTPAPSMSPAKTCAGGVGASSATSCDFAFNVAGEYGSNPGATSIRAYSPVTGQFYTMSCTAMSGWSAVCTGGAGAAVFIP